MRVVVLALILGGPALARADSWTGPDKALHFGVSAALAQGAYQTSALFADAPKTRAEVGASFALSLGVAKELYDLSGRGDPSFKDLAADAAGTAASIGVALAIDWVLRDRRSWRAALATALGG